MTKNTQNFTPNLKIEAKFRGIVAGVDEAGRGPLAGPVIAAAVILDTKNLPIGINDSKKLTQKAREHLFDVIINNHIVGIGIAEPEEIDRVNILQASLIAMQRAVAELDTRPEMILVDGNKCPDLTIPCQAIIKGDSKSISIAAASIIAKTLRDRIMMEADTRFPGYDFAKHKGYPTKAHKQALLDIGVSPLHRRTYAPVATLLTKSVNQA